MLGLGSQARPFLRYVVLVAVATVMVLFYSQAEMGPGLIDLVANNSSLGLLGTSPPAHHHHPDWGGFGSPEKHGFLVWSPSCQIPDVDPYDESIRGLLKPADPIVCSREPPLTYTTPIDEANRELGYILKIDTALLDRYVQHGQHLTCCYSNITRYSIPDDHKYNKEADNYYNISSCNDFEKQIQLKPQEEFILVRCNTYKKGKGKVKKEVYVNMHAVVPLKPSVRKKYKQSKTNENLLNVLLVGIDSMSRLNLQRTMPRTQAYLRHSDWLELKGYNKVGDNTFPNLMAILTGLNMDQIKDLCWPNKTSKLDNCPFVWKDYHKNGYISAYAEDEPTMSTFNYHKTGFVKPPTDYYFRPYMLAGIKKLSTRSRNNLDICMGPVPTTDHLLKYAIEFVTTFRNSHFFSLFWLNNFSHNNMNTPSAMDLRVLQFFSELSGTGIYNNTLVVFFSDHGMRFGKIRETYVGWLEERLPFIYFWVPEWFRNKYTEAYESLVSNKERLTSPYDLHVTLKELLDSATNTTEANTSASLACPKCRSLFLEEFGDRSCEDAGITPHWCTCTQYTDLPVTDTHVQKAAKYVLTEIQKKIKSDERNSTESKLCAELVMNRVVKARMKVHREGQKKDHDDYVVIFETLPGVGLFEATVRHKEADNSFYVMGMVSRINLYASHSNCVKDAELKLYCFCLTP